MAAALYNKITGKHDASSAGTYVGSDSEPEDVVIETRFSTPAFFEFMEEKGIYIRDNRTRKLLPEMIEESDVIISMAEEPFVPGFLSSSKKAVFWNVENPTLATREVSEKTYFQIEELVKAIIRTHNF
jgi:protein-tyrosine-phosphatase